jgi:hypothetical protein
VLLELDEIHERSAEDPTDDFYGSRFEVVELDDRGQPVGRIGFTDLESHNRIEIDQFPWTPEGVQPEVERKRVGTLWDELESIRAAAAIPESSLGDPTSFLFRDATTLQPVSDPRLFDSPVLPAGENASTRTPRYGPEVFRHLQTMLPKQTDSFGIVDSVSEVRIFRSRNGHMVALAQWSTGRYDGGTTPLRSPDGGINWTRGEREESLSVGGIVGATTFGRSDTILMATRDNRSHEMGAPTGEVGRLLISENGGLAWRDLTLPQPWESWSSFSGVAIAPHRPSLIVVGLENTNAPTGLEGPHVIRTWNSGKDWEELRVGMSAGQNDELIIRGVTDAGDVLATLRERVGESIRERAIMWRGLQPLERIRGTYGLSPFGSR